VKKRTYIILYQKNTMYVKSGHTTMVDEVRNNTTKPHYIP